jgi:formate dehydrogenase major subunit
MTGKVDELNELSGKSFIEINPNTARKLKIADGERLKISSRRGEIETTAKITDIVEEDIFFMPFHFADGAANYLSNTTLDEICKIPDLKLCAIKVEKLK